MRASDRTTVGRTGVEVTRLGLGTAPIGGMFTAVSVADAHDTVARAYDAGLRYFDTAPHYGAGLSETRLGAALAGRPREEFTLSTKMGRILVPGDQEQQFWAEPNGLRSEFDFSYEAALASHTDSLRRLGQDRVDIALIHDPDDHYEQAMAGTYPALRELRDGGAIGAIGAGMNQTSMPARLARESDFDIFLIAGRYNLLDASALDELLPLCEDKQISVVAAGVFHAGLLADPDNPAAVSYLPQGREYLAKAQAIRKLADGYQVPLRAVALQFPAAHPAVSTVVVGARTPGEVDDAVAMYEWDIPGQLWRDLKAAGLLPEQAPTP